MSKPKKRGKRTSTLIDSTMPETGEEIRKLASVIKDRFFRKSAEEETEEETKEVREVAKKLKQTNNDRITEATRLVQEVNLGSEYVGLLDGESAVKVLQAVDSLPERKRRNNTHKTLAVKKALEPFRLYKNLERLLKASKKLEKGDKEAHEDYLVAFSRVFSPDKLDGLRSLVSGDSLQIKRLAESLREKSKETQRILTVRAQEINKGVKKEKTELDRYTQETFDTIDAKTRKAQKALDQRAQEIDSGVNDTVRTFGEKITEGKKALDQKAQEIRQDVEQEKAGLDKHAQEAQQAVENKAEAVQGALDKRAQEIDKGIRKEKAELEQQIKDAHWEVFNKAKEAEQDLKKGKAELDKHAKEAYRTIDDKAREIRQDVEQEKAELGRKANETYRAVDAKARKAERDLEKKAKEVVEFSRMVKEGLKIGKAGLDKHTQEAQQAVENKAEEEKRALNQRAQETYGAIDTKARKAERDLEKKAKEVVEFSRVVKEGIKIGNEELTSKVKAAQKALDQRAQEIDSGVNDTVRTFGEKITEGKKALDQKAQEIDRSVNDTVRTFGKRVTKEKRALNQRVKKVRIDIDQGKADLDAHTQEAYQTIDGKARDLYELERSLDQRIKGAGRAVARKVAAINQTLDRKVRKLQKPKRSFKKLGLLAAAILGAVGLYKGLKPEQPKISVKPTGKPYRSVRLAKDGNYGEVLIADRKVFCRNPYSTDQKFYPIDAIARIEAGKTVPLKGVKWIGFRTDRYEGGADVNKDRQRDLIDSRGNTYTSHPRVRTIFTGGRFRKK